MREDREEPALGDSGEAAAAGQARSGASADGVAAGRASGDDASGDGASGGGGAGGEGAPPNPFAAVRARTLIPWMLLVYPGLVLLAFLTGHLVRADMEGQAFQFLGDYVPLSVAMITWALWAARRNGVGIRRLIGRLPAGYSWLPALGILPVAMVFSLGSAIIIEYLVSLFAPGHIEWLMNIKMIPDADSGLLYVAAWCLAIVVVAPTVEETLFRSMLINRWGTKWSLSTAVIASSLFFGVIHLTFWVGPAMLGLVLAVMYIRSRTLIVPIVVHAANNLIAVSLGFSGGDAAEALDQAAEGLFADPLVGGTMMAVSLPILIWYLRRNWPTRDAAVPYMEAGAESPSS